MPEGSRVKIRPMGVGDRGFLLRWWNDHDYSGDFEPYEPVAERELDEWLSLEKRSVSGSSLRLAGRPRVR